MRPVLQTYSSYLWLGQESEGCELLVKKIPAEAILYMNTQGYL